MCVAMTGGDLDDDPVGVSGGQRPGEGLSTCQQNLDGKRECGDDGGTRHPHWSGSSTHLMFGYTDINQ